MGSTDDVIEKATEMFKVCDLEGKGFITKRDMQRLRGDSLIGLAPEHLDEVFELLDRDRSGYLTLEELKVGFGAFLSSHDENRSCNNGTGRSNGLDNSSTLNEDDEYEDAQFDGLLENLGARGLFINEDYVKNLWRHFKRDDATLMGHFEVFLQKVVKEIRKGQSEYTSLENAFKSRSSMHDNEIRKIYEEMENQMKTDREQILAQERARERRIREELEDELHQKEKALLDLTERHSKMEKQLKMLNTAEHETKMEYSKLLKEKDLLEQRLESSEHFLVEAQKNIDSIRQKEMGSRRERAKAAFRVSEGIAMEREGLVKQLDILRNVNRKLVDEKDLGVEPSSANEEPLSSELEGQSLSERNLDSEFSPEEESLHRSRYERRSGSVLSNYFTNVKPLPCSTAEECEVDDGFYTSPTCFSPSYGSEYPETSCSEYEECTRVIKPQFRTQRVSELKNLHAVEQRIEEFTNHVEEFCHAHDSARPAIKGEWKVKRRIYSDSDGETQGSDIVCGNPERLYKIVFIGDSGVGKSSFIQRFCNDTFRPNFSATIGVDFQVRSVLIDGHIVALQLWDTAGQERFRSITKQYYRKADGVIIMFDVTSEISFRNVRNWMTDVKSGADESTVLLLVGNKIDQCLEESTRVVKSEEGQRQAKDFGSLYQETSAKTGDGVEDAILAMAALLQVREDEVMERALKLRDHKKKRRCC